MNRKEAPQQLLERLPKKWALAIVVALIGYVLLQPMLNSRFGWKLPSLAGLSGNETPQVIQGKTPDRANTKARSTASDSVVEGDSSEVEASESDSLRDDKPDDSQPQKTQPEKTQPKNSQSGQEPRDAVEQADPDQPTSKQPSSKQPASKQPASKQSSSKSDESDLLYGLLKDTGREVYVSPAGLRYTRGSEEGHRLKHIEKHLKDQPDRPGKHGVFDGDMAQVLRWIDDAYSRSKQGAKGVRKRDEDGRTVIEAPFAKPIGFIGGRDGKRTNNPEAKKLRLVVEEDRVITAFPF